MIDVPKLTRDRLERLNWSDPTGETAMNEVPEWLWERMAEMLEYLAFTYGTEGLVRANTGQIEGCLERPINHGTRGGYLAHIRRGIVPCRHCSEANTADFLRRRKDKRSDRSTHE